MTLGTFGDVNYLAVLVAAIAYFAIGAVWYAPPVLGRAWMDASGVRPQEGRTPTPLLVLAFVAAFVASLVLAFLARASGADGFGEGIVLGLVCGVGFALTALVVTQRFENRPPTLPWINAGYHILGLLVAAIIVTVWD